MSGEWLHLMDGEGCTPLNRAIRSGHQAIPELMLHQHVYDQAANPERTTPLHRAAFLGLTEAVKTLLAYGARVSALDGCQEIPLHKAVREGHVDAVAVLAPLSDVNRRSDSGMSPLHWACLTGNREIVDLLLLNGADAWLRNESLDGLTPVDLAQVMGYGELTSLLPGACAAA